MRVLVRFICLFCMATAGFLILQGCAQPPRKVDLVKSCEALARERSAIGRHLTSLKDKERLEYMRERAVAIDYLIEEKACVKPIRR
ncbi:MAG: hypothetical protein LBN32_03925 [Helicobacteraceae bacterium]|nr:hypothetical protein [Helicobacteraceae bacterium]